jgi:hypothetical protein
MSQMKKVSALKLSRETVRSLRIASQIKAGIGDGPVHPRGGGPSAQDQGQDCPGIARQ